LYSMASLKKHIIFKTCCCKLMDMQLGKDAQFKFTYN
jgi:hypothetical protein